MILIFLLLTFLISWSIWFMLPMIYGDLVMFVPGIIAITLLKYQNQNIKKLFKNTFKITTLQGLALPAAVCILYILLALLLNTETFGIPQEALLYNNNSYMVACTRLLIFGVPSTLGINLIFSCFEEIGWRGYLLQQISIFTSKFLYRSLFVGLVWGIWHLPIYIMIQVSWVNIVIFLINVCLISICYTWLYERSQSIWPTTIAHALHNTLFNYLLPILTLSSSHNHLLIGEEGFIMTLCYTLIIISSFRIIQSKKLQQLP